MSLRTNKVSVAISHFIEKMKIARRSTKVDHYSGVAELALRETSLATPQLHNNPVNPVRFEILLIMSENLLLLN